MPIPNSTRRFHIVIDAYNCKPEQLEDKGKIDQVIREITSLCKMSILHGPIVIEGQPDNPGVTGFAIIDFSHISIHTFTADKEVCVDIFSCKPFDCEKVRKYVEEAFELENGSVKYVEVKY